MSLTSEDDDFIHLSHSDLNEMYSYLADMDCEISTQQPSVSHLFDVALSAKVKDDPDSPSFHDAITGEYADEYWEAMDKEIEGLSKQKYLDLHPMIINWKGIS